MMSTLTWTCSLRIWTWTWCYLRNCIGLYRVGQKYKPILIYQEIVLKPADEATFSLKLNVEQATEVNAKKHLSVIIILSIKYSMYDVKCDVN